MSANLSLQTHIILLAAAYFGCAYLLGSIPVAWLIARWATGQDLRCMGSGNVGVMNTALSVARWAGLIAFLGEIAKGILSVVIPHQLGAQQPLVGLSVVATVIGTRWPVWLGFKGGRGNTAGLSASLLISYPSMLIVLACWSAARLVLKKSFLATRVTLLAFPVIFWLVTHSLWISLTALGLSGLFLNAQRPTSDDHLIINQRWSSLAGFITSPPRRG